LLLELMMLGNFRVLPAVLAAALLVASTSAAAAVPAAPASVHDNAPVSLAANPWLTLSAMTGSSSSVAIAVAAQEEGRPGTWPPLASLTAILATIGTAIYILLDDDDSNNVQLQPLSPA
jgi:hypothetical protein